VFEINIHKLAQFSPFCHVCIIFQCFCAFFANLKRRFCPKKLENVFVLAIKITTNTNRELRWEKILYYNIVLIDVRNNYKKIFFFIKNTLAFGLQLLLSPFKINKCMQFHSGTGSLHVYTIISTVLAKLCACLPCKEQHQGPYSQHFIFFLTYKLAK